MTSRRWVSIIVAVVGMLFIMGVCGFIINVTGWLANEPANPQITEPEIAEREPGEPGDLPLTGKRVFLGQVFAARNVDVDDCPVDASLSFTSDDNIYIIAVNANLPEGTEMGIRVISQADSEQVVYVSPELVADEDYIDACVSFNVETEDMAEGAYSVEVIADGIIEETLGFSIDS